MRNENLKEMIKTKYLCKLGSVNEKVLDKVMKGRSDSIGIKNSKIDSIILAYLSYMQ